MDILYFPVWWYTGGLKLAAGRLYDLFQMGNEHLAPGVWIVNIFVPMYGQYDWEGRLISFFVRVIQIIFRTIFLFVWLIICLVLLGAWIVFPIVVVSGLSRSLMLK